MAQAAVTAKNLRMMLCFFILVASKLCNFEWQMTRGPAKAAGEVQATKKAFAPPWDKSHCFCDTTQIDVKKRPLAYAYHHTRPDG